MSTRLRYLCTINRTKKINDMTTEEILTNDRFCSFATTAQKMAHIKETREAWEFCGMKDVSVEPCLIKMQGNKVLFSEGEGGAKFAAKATFIDHGGNFRQIIALFHTAVRGELNFSAVETPGFIVFNKLKYSQQ